MKETHRNGWIIGIVVTGTLCSGVGIVAAANAVQPPPAPAETPSETPTPTSPYTGYACYPQPVNPDGTCPTPLATVAPTDEATDEAPTDMPSMQSTEPLPNINGPNVHRPKTCKRHWYC